MASQSVTKLVVSAIGGEVTVQGTLDGVKIQTSRGREVEVTENSDLDALRKALEGINGSGKTEQPAPQKPENGPKATPPGQAKKEG